MAGINGLGTVDVFSGGLPFVGMQATMAAANGAVDVYSADPVALTDSGFYVTINKPAVSAPTYELKNPWQARSEQTEGATKEGTPTFNLGTQQLTDSKFGLVFTQDILPFVQKVYQAKTGVAKDAAQDYLMTLSALVKQDETWQTNFPSREAYLFAVAETVARVDQLTNADTDVLRKKAHGINALISGYNKAEAILKDAGYEKMPEVVLKAWSGDVVFAYTAPGQASSYIQALRDALPKYPKVREYVETNVAPILSEVGIKLQDILDGNLTDESLKASQTSQSLILAVQNALNKIKESYWYFSELNRATTGYSQGLLSGASEAGVVSPDESLRMVSIDGPAMAASEPYLNESMPMVSVMGMAPNKLYEIALATTLHVNFLKGFDAQNSLIEKIKAQGLLTEEQIDQLTKSLSAKDVADLQKQFKEKMIFGEFLPVAAMAQNEALRQKYAFLDLVYKATVRSLFGVNENQVADVIQNAGLGNIDDQSFVSSAQYQSLTQYGWLFMDKTFDYVYPKLDGQLTADRLGMEGYAQAQVLSGTFDAGRAAARVISSIRKAQETKYGGKDSIPEGVKISLFPLAVTQPFHGVTMRDGWTEAVDAILDSDMEAMAGHADLYLNSLAMTLNEVRILDETTGEYREPTAKEKLLIIIAEQNRNGVYFSSTLRRMVTDLQTKYPGKPIVLFDQGPTDVHARGHLQNVVGGVVSIVSLDTQNPAAGLYGFKQFASPMHAIDLTPSSIGVDGVTRFANQTGEGALPRYQDEQGNLRYTGPRGYLNTVRPTDLEEVSELGRRIGSITELGADGHLHLKQHDALKRLGLNKIAGLAGMTGPGTPSLVGAVAREGGTAALAAGNFPPFLTRFEPHAWQGHFRGIIETQLESTRRTDAEGKLDGGALYVYVGADKKRYLVSIANPENTESGREQAKIIDAEGNEQIIDLRDYSDQYNPGKAPTKAWAEFVQSIQGVAEVDAEKPRMKTFGLNVMHAQYIFNIPMVQAALKAVDMGFKIGFMTVGLYVNESEQAMKDSLAPYIPLIARGVSFIPLLPATSEIKKFEEDHVAHLKTLLKEYFSSTDHFETVLRDNSFFALTRKESVEYDALDRAFYDREIQMADTENGLRGSLRAAHARFVTAHPDLFGTIEDKESGLKRFYEQNPERYLFIAATEGAEGGGHNGLHTGTTGREHAKAINADGGKTVKIATGGYTQPLDVADVLLAGAAPKGEDVMSVQVGTALGMTEASGWPESVQRVLYAAASLDPRFADYVFINTTSEYGKPINCVANIKGLAEGKIASFAAAMVLLNGEQTLGNKGLLNDIKIDAAKLWDILAAEPDQMLQFRYGQWQQKVQTSYEFFRSRFDDKLDLFDIVWQSLLNKSNAHKKQQAVSALAAYLNPARVNKDEKDDAYIKRRDPALANFKKFFVEFRTQNAQIAGLDPDWVYVLGGMSIQNLPQEWIKRYFATESLESSGQVLQYGQRFTVQELLNHLHTGTERYLEELAAKAAGYRWAAVQSRDLRQLSTVKGLDVSIQSANGDADLKVVSAKVVGAVDVKDLTDAFQKQGAGLLSALLNSAQIRSDVSGKSLTNRLVDFITPDKGSSYELLIRNTKTGPVLEAIRFYDEVRGDTRKPFLFAEAKITGDETVSLQVYNPSHYLDPSKGEPVVASYNFSLKPVFENGPKDFFVDVRQYQRDSMAMLHKALLGEDMPDYAGVDVAAARTRPVSFDADKGYAFNRLVAAGERHVVDIRNPEPIALHVFGVAAQALAGAIELQGHPDSGIADVTKLLHEGITINLGDSADLTIRSRTRGSQDINLTANNRLTKVERDSATGGLRKQTLTQVTDSSGVSVFEIANRTITLDSEAGIPAASLQARLDAQATQAQIIVPKVTHEIPEANRGVIWEAKTDLTVTRSAIRQYGAVDANVFHHWDKLAKSAGQEKGIIAQGMLTAAMMFSQVVGGYFGGSTKDIKSISVKFEGKALPEDSFRTRLVRKGLAENGYEIFEAQLITLTSPNVPIVRMDIIAKGPDVIGAIAGQAFEEANMFDTGSKKYVAPDDATEAEKARFKKGTDAYTGFVKLADKFVQKNMGFDLVRVVKSNPKLIEFTVQDDLGMWLKDETDTPRFYKKGERVVIRNEKGVLFHAAIRQIATVTVELASFLAQRAMGLPTPNRFIVSSLGLTAATAMVGTFGDTAEDMLQALLVAWDRAMGIGLVGGQFGLMKGLCFAETEKLTQAFNAEFGQGKNVIWATNENTATVTGIGSVDTATMEAFADFVKERNTGEKELTVEVDANTKFSFHSEAMAPAAQMFRERQAQRKESGQIKYDASKIVGRIHLDARKGELAKAGQDPIEEIAFQIDHSIHMVPSIAATLKAANGRRVRFVDVLPHKTSVSGMVGAAVKKLKPEDAAKIENLAVAGKTEELGALLASKVTDIELRELKEPKKSKPSASSVAPSGSPQTASVTANATSNASAPVVVQSSGSFGRYAKEDEAVAGLKNDAQIAQAAADMTGIFLGRTDVTVDKKFAELGIDTVKGPQLMSVSLERFGISPKDVAKVDADSIGSLSEAMSKLVGSSIVNVAYVALNPVWSKNLSAGHVQNLGSDAVLNEAAEYIASFGPGVLNLVDQVMAKAKKLKADFAGDAQKRVAFFEKALELSKPKLEEKKRAYESQNKSGGGVDVNDPEFRQAVEKISDARIAEKLGLVGNTDRAIHLADGTVAVPMQVNRKGELVPVAEAAQLEAAAELAKIKANGDKEYLGVLTAGSWTPTQLHGWKNIDLNGSIDALNGFAETFRENILAGNYVNGSFKDPILNQWLDYQVVQLANQMGEKSMAWLAAMISQYDLDNVQAARSTEVFNPDGKFNPVAEALMRVYNLAMTEVTDAKGASKPIFQTNKTLKNGIDPLALVPKKVRLLYGLPDPVEIVPTGESIDEFYKKAQENNWMSGELLKEVDRLRKGEVADLSHVRALILAGTSTAAKPMIAFLLSKGAKVRMTSTRHFDDVQGEFRSLFQKYAVRGAELDVAWNFKFNEMSVIQLVDKSLDDGFVPNVFANAGAVEDYLPFNMPTVNGSNSDKNHFEAVMNALVKTTVYALRYLSQRYLETGNGVTVQWLNFDSPAAESPLPGSNTYPFAKSGLHLDTIDNIVRVEGLHHADGSPVIVASHLKIGATLPSAREAGKIMSGQVKDATIKADAIEAATGAKTVSFWAEQMGLNLVAMISLFDRIQSRDVEGIHRQHSVGGFDDERVMGKLGDKKAPYTKISADVKKVMDDAEAAVKKAAEAKYGKRQITYDEALELRAEFLQKEGHSELAAADKAAAQKWREEQKEGIYAALNHPFAYGHPQRLVGDNVFMISDASGLDTFDARRHRKNHLADEDVVIVSLAGTTSSGKNIFDASRSILGKRGLDVAGGIPWKSLAALMKGPVKANDGSNRIVGTIVGADEWDKLDDKKLLEQKKLILNNYGFRALAQLVANNRKQELELQTTQKIEINGDDKALVTSLSRLNDHAKEKFIQGGGDETKFVAPYAFFDVYENGQKKSYVIVKKNAELLADVVGRVNVTMFADLPANFFDNLRGIDKEELLFEATTSIFGRLTTTQLTEMMGLSLPNLQLKFGGYLLEYFVGRGMVDNAGKNLLEAGSRSDQPIDSGKGVISGIGNSQGSAGTQQLGAGGMKRNLAAACATGLEVVYNIVDHFNGLEAQAKKGMITAEEFYSTVIYGISMEYGALPSTHVGFDGLGDRGAMTREEFAARQGRKDARAYAPHDLLRDGFLAGVATSGFVTTTRRMAKLMGVAPLLEIIGAAATSDFHMGYDGGKAPRAETAPGLAGQALLNWIIHGIITKEGFTTDNVVSEVSHSTGTDGDTKQPKGLSASERARNVREQKLAFEFALKAVMELGHTLGGTAIEAIQAAVLFLNGIIPGHLSLNNLTHEQHNRLSTAISRINIKFSGHIRPMQIDDVMLVYNFGFHSENRAAAFGRPMSAYSSLNEALLTQREIIKNRAQQAATFVATNRTFEKNDILPWDADMVRVNKFSTPKFMAENAQILAEMEVFEELYRNNNETFDAIFKAVHGTERATGQRLFSYKYENLANDIRAYKAFKAKLAAGTITGYRLITDADWQSYADRVVIVDDLNSALTKLGVQEAWAKEYIADRRRFTADSDLTDFYGDIIHKMAKFHGAVDQVGLLNSEFKRVGFRDDQLTAVQKQALGLFIAQQLNEALAKKKTPTAMNITAMVNKLVKIFPNAVQTEDMSGRFATRFGVLPRTLGARLPNARFANPQ